MNSETNGEADEMPVNGEAKKGRAEKVTNGKRTASQLPEAERAKILEEYSSGTGAKEIAARFNLKTPLIVYNLAQKAGVGSGTRKGKKRGPGRPKGSKNKAPRQGTPVKFRTLTELELVRMENRVLRAALDQIPGANDLLRRVSRG